MEKIVQPNLFLEQTVSLDALHPFGQTSSFPVDDADPRSRILRAFPLLLPGCRHRVGHQLSSLGLCFRSEQLLALEHSHDACNAFVNIAED